jgi:Fe-S oxidoreductase
MEKLGAEYEVMPVGCCGMAGAFGFEADHYDVSVEVGELGFLNAARELSSEQVFLTDGFSCREQAVTLADASPIHLAQFLEGALGRGDTR